MLEIVLGAKLAPRRGVCDAWVAIIDEVGAGSAFSIIHYIVEIDDAARLCGILSDNERVGSFG